MRIACRRSRIYYIHIFTWIMTEEQAFDLLARVMYETRKNKRYGGDSVAFEWCWSCKLVRMFDALMTKEFRVDNNYAFLTSYPKWREIFATSFEGRIADHLVCDLLRPYIELELHPRTFNNRVDKGSQAAINQVIEDIAEVTNGYRDDARVIKWDLKGFFPNAWCNHMEACFNEVIEKYRQDIAAEYGDDIPDFLRWLAMICIHCNAANNCELRTPQGLWAEHIEPEKSLFYKEPGVGVPIGRLTSQTGMGLYINDDVCWLNDECGIHTTVFMDDGVMVVPEWQHEYALSLIPELRKRLEAKGVRLNDKKFYDQPWRNGLEFLGTHINPWRLHLNDKTYNRAIERIREFNAIEDKYRFIEKFKATVNSYTGLLKNRTEYRRICALRDAIAPEWWKWLEWDNRRQCIVSKPEYNFCQLLNRKYHLKLKQHDKSRNHRAH